VATARAVGLLLGVLADGALGDPRRAHPVAAFGRAARALENRIHADDRWVGTAFTVSAVGSTIALGVLVERIGRRHAVLRVIGTAAATWAVLGGTSLAREGTAMARSLDSGDLAAARDRLPNLCGRDPSDLDGAALARAAVESVAENTSDAVVAPLLWGAIAGAPGLLAYRAANTLDAMVGYRSPRYRRFGWASARLDDLVNLVPARITALLTVAAAPVVGGSAARAWRTRRLDAHLHPSPNAGQVEAAFAGALEVRLGGRTVYPHGAEERPVLGDGVAPDAGHITRAVELSRLVAVLAAVLSGSIALLVRPRRRRCGTGEDPTGGR
jgi:adenosylcobinamide-phosphate synthase